MVGGSNGMGATPGMVGGSNGMGATPGMVGGSNGMGATPGMVGGNNGIGAVGGSGTPDPIPGMTDEQCPATSCAEGDMCPPFLCIDGYCGQTLPGAEPACAKIVCGDPCMAPDGTVGTCDEAGECSGRVPVCGPAPMQ